MGRQQNDKWLRLALIWKALRKHGRGGAKRLIRIKKVIHRFIAPLLYFKGEESASELGEAVWQRLLESHPARWKEIYNATVSSPRAILTDDPVPRAAVEALDDDEVDLKALADALQEMPLRTSSNIETRLKKVRDALKSAEKEIWKQLLSASHWNSPLLVMDEAHHLKNPETNLARQLQASTIEGELRVGDGAMSKAFERMLFLTATPFQLGHQELVRVLQRFGDVRWEGAAPKARQAAFKDRMKELEHSLTESQRTAIALQRAWSKLGPDDGPGDGCVDRWWDQLHTTPGEQLTIRQRALIEAHAEARKWRIDAEAKLRRWVIRHNKGKHWPDKPILRRDRMEGAAVLEPQGSGGLTVPRSQLLPFFLAARSATVPGKDLLGEALCSSYEAFRNTRQSGGAEKDEDESDEETTDLTHSSWYLSEFDELLDQRSGEVHPKIAATVNRVVDLWESGEKVLVFAFYRRTCRALRIHISREIERRVERIARERAEEVVRTTGNESIDELITRIQREFMDSPKSPERRALDQALGKIVLRRHDAIKRLDFNQHRCEDLLSIMRRFLRVRTTLIRCFPFELHESAAPDEVVEQMLDRQDDSAVSWRAKFETFVDFLVDQCSDKERGKVLEAAYRTQTGAISVGADASAAGDDDDDDDDDGMTRTLPNVRLATGQTKRSVRTRLMRAFNTPFFPDIFVCSEVMGEGVDLQRHCRFVIHHDLAWNPSQIEQRTGRIDRLGCKAENKHPMQVLLPYIAGASDERQFRVMTDREQWFRIVMGQDKVAELIPPDADRTRPDLPTAFGEELSFNLGLEPDTAATDNVTIAEVARESRSDPVTP